MSRIEIQLDQLHETRTLFEKFQGEKAAKIDAATPLEVKQRLADIEHDYEPALSAALSEIARLESEIKAAVAVRGETIRSTRLQAVFIKGRQSWDNASLDHYAETHPEIIEFRRVGNPSVSIRII